MQYKTKEDVLRVIAKQKPEGVIDMFIESFLLGEALQPYFEIEQEYADLLAQEDVPDVEPVVDPETLEVLTEGYSPNEIRDARILELEADYPYLDDPADATTVAERRPVPVLDQQLATQLKKTFVKSAFEDAMSNGKLLLSLGWEIDCRRSGYRNDISNMEGLLKLQELSGADDADLVAIKGADNGTHNVTVGELRNIILHEMYQYGAELYQRKWAFESAVDAATTATEVLQVKWT